MTKAKVMDEIINEDEIKETIRDSKGLRNMLFEEIDNLRRQKITASHARAIARIAENILNSVKVELYMVGVLQNDREVKMIETPSIKLGD